MRRFWSVAAMVMALAVISICSVERFPLQVFALLACLGGLFVALACLARGAVTRYFCIIVFSLCLPLAGVEYYYYDMVKEEVGIHVERGGIFAKGLAHKDPVLGYAPVPGASVRSRAVRDGVVLYDVTYTIGQDGWRITYPAPNADTAVVFFGCSFTLGEGLQDDENFAYLVGKLSKGRYKVFNYGLSGYGPHHMLALIQHGLPELAKYKRIVAFHVAIRGHQRRSAGLSPWDKDGPRYFLENGKVVRRGTFADNPPYFWEGPMEDWFSHSYTFLGLREQLTEVLGPLKTLRERLELTEAIIVESAREFRRQFPGSTFEVLAWPPDTAEMLTAALEKQGVPVIDVEQWLPGYAKDSEQYAIPGDGHPNAKADRLVAQHIVELLGQRVQP